MNLFCCLRTLAAGLALFVGASGANALAATPMVATGLDHTCVLNSGGGVKCWGDNNSGQLGDGTTTKRPTPVDVSGLTSGVIAIAAGGGAGSGHTCAVTGGGGVKCWGLNLDGQLGDNSFTSMMQTAPVDVSGLTSGATAITAGTSHTCAVSGGGGVKCWGWDSFGQLGDGTSYPMRRAPVDVSGLSSGATAIAAGNAHTCALTSGGGVKCWGDNVYGELGDNSTTMRLAPVDVSGLASGATSVATGNGHTCAMTGSGGVKCWGDNGSGQLGDNSTTRRLTPVDVVGLSASTATLPISDARVFAFAEANYPGLFAGTPAAGQYQQYDYRYYPSSQNYLAVDTAGMIFLLGPVTGGVVAGVGAVESFRTPITTWESSVGLTY